MPSTNKHTPDEHARELEALRRYKARAEARIAHLEKICHQFRHCAYKTAAVDDTAPSLDTSLETMQMAQVIVDNSPAILFRRLAGEDPRLVYVSSNINRTGYTAEEFISGTVQFRDIVHPDDVERLGDEIQAFVAQDVEEYTQYYRIVTRDGHIRWVEDQTSVVRNAAGEKTHHQGIVVDITARVEAEAQLRKSEEKFRRIVETTGEGFLLMDENLVIKDANRAYCEMLGYERDEILGKTPFDLASEEFRQYMAANRERILAMDYRKFEGAVRTKDGRTVPVLIHGNTLRDDQGKQIGNVAFVADLTEQKKALALAGKVQKNLIPNAAPDIKGLDVAGRSDSCEEVGGDYFDYFAGSDDHPANLKVVVGDISGHGVDAALLMTSARAFIRMEAAQPVGPAQMVSSMNRNLSVDMGETGHFMTLFLLEIDPEAQTARWVRAGHDPALVFIAQQDKFEELTGPGLPLGVDEDFDYAEYSLTRLPTGTVIALGTDGIWEATDPAGRAFGKKRLRTVIRENAQHNSKKILEAVFKAVSEFTRGVPPHDDVTLVIVKVVGHEEKNTNGA